MLLVRWLSQDTDFFKIFITNLFMNGSMGMRRPRTTRATDQYSPNTPQPYISIEVIDANSWQHLPNAQVIVRHILSGCVSKNWLDNA